MENNMDYTAGQYGFESRSRIGCHFMKLLLINAIVVISLLSAGVLFPSCGADPSRKCLADVERLVDEDPDSARIVLAGIDTTSLDEDGTMLRRLFMLEISDKLYETHKDDKEVSALLDYFIDKNRMKRFHPEVYYYAGRVYYDLGRDAEALSYFKKALRSLKKGEDRDLQGRIHSQMCYLYFDHRLYNYSARHIKEAIRLSEEDNDTVNIIGGKLYLADVYLKRVEPDSAELVYDSLAEMACECSDTVTATTYYTQLAIFYYYSDRVEKADSIINNTTLKYDKSTRTSVLCIKNKIDRRCKGKGIDEDFYMSLLDDTDPGIRFMAAKYIAQGAEARGDVKMMLEYTQRAFKEMKETQKKFNNSTIVEMEKIMEEADLENENLQLSLANQRKQVIILVIVIFFILAAGISAVLIVKMRMRRIAVTLELERLNAENNLRIRELESEIRGMREEQSRKGSEEIGEKTEELTAALNLAREKERMVKLLLSAEESVGEEDFVRLRSALLSVYPTFIERIDSMGLRQQDYHDTLLLRIGVPQKVCASFFGVTPSALVNSRKRLLRKWSQEGNFKNWKEFLETL